MGETTTRINERKSNAVQSLVSFIKGGEDIIFTDFRGLNVEQITSLRNRLRDRQSEYRVVKNSYTKIAIAELGLPDVEEFLFGPTGIALSKKDAGPVAKVILDFSKESPVRVKGGIVGGRIFSPEEIIALSELPSRELLIAKLMATMNAPIQYFVYALNGVVTKLVRTLQAVADKKQENGS
ncbi:MAG TPA: 50S ribosomal protein L10 [Spirochaetia bacterium]|nr:50S ribosomal protein L10 [Spirochaetia bacterium]